MAQLVARLHDKQEAARSIRAGTTLAPVVQRIGHLITNQAGAGSSPAGGTHARLAQWQSSGFTHRERGGSSPPLRTVGVAELAQRAVVGREIAGSIPVTYPKPG